MLEKFVGNAEEPESSMTYLGDFQNWKDVQEQFRINEPEPDEVLAALYELGSYEGSAEVIYRRGDDYYIASGSHCSCYGLEHQWEPEKYDRATIKAALEKGAGKQIWSGKPNAYAVALNNWKD